MEVMNQGNEYKEQETEILEDKKPKIPKKLLFIGVAVMVVGIGLAAAFSGGGGTPTEVDPSQEAQTDVDGTGEFTDIDGNPIADPFAIVYTEDELKQLRDYGYTGTQIEQFQTEQRLAVDLINEAKAGREKVLQEMYVELNSKAQQPGTPEFQALMNMTWLQGKPRTVASADTAQFEINRIKENCRYVKVPARGPQLFIKLTLDSTGEAVFYNVTPQQYSALKEQGQMVITYDQVKFGDLMYVTNIQEVAI